MRALRQRSGFLAATVTSASAITAHHPLTVARWCSQTTTAAGSVTTGSTSISNIGSEMKAKGFVNPTPNFDVNFSDVPNVEDLAADIHTEPAVNVDYMRDIYGPWLVMTEDLQGELFLDHDRFVFYRPANGLGYGIGKVEVIDAGPTGTAFNLRLDSYTYQQTAAIAPQFGLEFSVTGMVKKVTSKSSSYTTSSLVGMWQKVDRNVGGLACPVRQKQEKLQAETTKKEGASSGGDDAAAAAPVAEPTSGQFNAAKLTPWDPTAAAGPWKPNEELVSVFRGVFPQQLNLTSHIRRAEEAKQAAKRARSTAAKGCFHVDLEPYAVGSIPGIYYIPNYLSKQEEADVARLIKSTPAELKSKIKKRTVQEWGCSMCEDCKQSFVADANMPPWVQRCTDMLVYDGIFTPTTFPNSVRIHEYECGEGIGPHCDGPIYVPIVTVLSLVSTSVMNFYPRQEPYYDHPMDHYNDTFKFKDGEIGRRTPLQSVVMEPGSLLIFSGEAYYYYPHGVSDEEVNDLSPQASGEVVNRHFLSEPTMSKVVRQYRSSITTRNLMTRCNDQPARAEYGMKRAWYQYNQLSVPDPLFMPAPLPAGHSAATVSANSQAATGAASVGHLGPLSSAELQRWEGKLDAIFSQQETLMRSLEELKEALVMTISANETFRKETSSVLNHVSSTVLDMDTKVDDVSDALADLKKASLQRS